ncbi:unnamed protein product [Adineta steineri]|uniref:Ketosynthase family 3 (KS3) domain-containing protein n=1 Tax=Adineta steineri TaxID=433720 RepID=A0A815K757_9BILA|nr:unnamed protein product [Adineta steineri]CAF4073284.1 unnamed protein product [Adineta steineri]
MSMSTSNNLLEPMAIVDIACEFAGDIHSATDLWQELQDNRDVSSATPRDRNLLLNSITGAKSPDGRSRSFNTDATGYAKGDSLGLILMKRLNDGERDGDRIYCVFGDALSSHNGNEDKTNFVVPSAVGQIRLLTNIYSRINFDAQRIFYIEAHSTGTPVGDPIEANCSGPFFNQSSLGPPLLIDSSKSNLGYTE